MTDMQATASGRLHDPHLADEYAESRNVHVVPIWALTAVLGALLLLTFLTVAVTWVNLGALNIWVALGIAVVKGSLVGLYFMHLRWDSAFNSLILISALLFLMLFIGITITDSEAYANNFEAPSGAQISASPTIPTM